MSVAYGFELLKDGKVVCTHYWRSWLDPEDANAHKLRCLGAMNEWHSSQGKEYGGIEKLTVPMVPDFDAIRFQWPPGTTVVVPVSHKNNAAVA